MALRSNRTFMELKYLTIHETRKLVCKVLIVPLWNWNLIDVGQRNALLDVLIVPLWNWNAFVGGKQVPDNLVLIVPLWNWNWAARPQRQPRKPRSNRTFMELKWLSPVVIMSKTSVLIVPLWNWNTCISERPKEITGSNCTFMKLKYGSYIGKQVFLPF